MGVAGCDDEFVSTILDFREDDLGVMLLIPTKLFAGVAISSFDTGDRKFWRGECSPLPFNRDEGLGALRTCWVANRGVIGDFTVATVVARRGINGLPVEELLCVLSSGIVLVTGRNEGLTALL
jgi:hypothetical protein